MALLLSGFFKVLIAVAGVILVRMMLIWFDGTKYGTKFTESVMADWTTEDKSRYYTGRLIGACLLVGLALF
jgi:hypothetical protein